jgi:hypothetical protein
VCTRCIEYTFVTRRVSFRTHSPTDVSGMTVYPEVWWVTEWISTFIHNADRFDHMQQCAPNNVSLAEHMFVSLIYMKRDICESVFRRSTTPTIVADFLTFSFINIMLFASTMAYICWCSIHRRIHTLELNKQIFLRIKISWQFILHFLSLFVVDIMEYVINTLAISHIQSPCKLVSGFERLE